MSEWISVKDRLPEEGLPSGRVQVTVMACTKAKKVIIASRVFEFERKFDYNGVTKIYPAHWMWSRGMNSKVTHWMPLPEPPSKNATTRPTSVQDHIGLEAWASEWLYDADKDTYYCANCRHTICASDYFENILPPYCEMCGKAMTEEALDELEKRLRG